MKYYGNYAIIAVAIPSFCISIWFLVFLLLICKQFCITNVSNPTKIPTPIKYITTTFFFMWSIAYLLNGIDIMIGIADVQSPLYYVLFVMLGIGVMLFYANHVFRLYYLFKDSAAFSISKRTIWCHFSLMLVVLIAPISGSLFFADYWIVYTFTFLWMSLLIFAGLIHLVYSFNRRLFLLVLEERKETIIKHELKVLDSVAKHTLLLSVQLITMLILAIMFAGLSLVKDMSDVGYIVYDWMCTVAIIVLGLCIYLGFSFKTNNKLYKCLCNKCHLKCLTQCTRMADRKLLDKKTIVKQSSQPNGQSSVVSDGTHV
eukprot:221907_1